MGGDPETPGALLSAQGLAGVVRKGWLPRRTPCGAGAPGHALNLVKVFTSRSSSALLGSVTLKLWGPGQSALACVSSRQAGSTHRVNATLPVILPPAAGPIGPHLFEREVATMNDPIVITVNGQPHTVEGAPETPLLYVLRDEMGLTGPQFGCGSETCKACTVLLGAREVQSCRLPVSEATDGVITTLEGLQAGRELHPIQRAFIDEQAAQCGYCLNGMVMTTAAFLYRHPHPSAEDIRQALDGNLCRCGAHARILRAVQLAADLPRRRSGCDAWLPNGPQPVRCRSPTRLTTGCESRLTGA